MALVVKDRVKDTTTTTGTGTITLANSPPNGYQAFSSLGDGSTTYYAIEDADKTNWEVGIGTYTLSGHTLARTTVLASTNSNNAISLSSGEHTVFCDYPSGKAFLSDEGIDKTFTADGTITAGKPTILTSAGKAQEVKETTTGAVTEAYSAETALNDPSEKVTVVSDGNNTFLQVYQGSSLYSTIQAGTMSGTTMTWGTAQVIESTDGSGQAIWWDSYRSCFVVVVRSTQGNSYIKASTITVSGQAITIEDNSITTVFSGSYDQSSMTGGYDSTAQVGFVVNSRGNSPTKTSVIVVQVDSSKNISWGSEVTSDTRIYYNSQFVHDANGNGNVAVIGATYNSSTTVEVNSTQAYVITISGTTPTIQTPVVLNASAYMHGYSVYDASANKTICIYDDATKVYYNVCSMSSGTLTAGTHTEIATGSISGDTQETAYCGCYDPFTQQIGIVYGDSSNYYYLRSGKVSGTSITWSDAQAVDPSTVNKHINLVNANSTDSNVLVLYWVNFDSAFNTWTMGKAGTTTANLDNNYLGVASTSATDGNEVQVNMPNKSINVDQTGLTIGEKYFCNTSGEIKKFITSSTSSTTSNSAFVEDSSNYANVITSISYCSTSGYYIKTFNDGSTGYPTYRTGTYNTSTNNIDWGTATTIQSYNLRGNYVICHANSSGAIGLLYTIKDGSTDILKCSTTTLSSGVLQGLTTAVSVVSDTTEEFYPLGIVYDAGQSRFVATWTSISGGTYPIYANAFQPDADNAPTWSSSNQITALAGGSADNLTAGNFHSLIYDPDTQRVVQFYYYMDSGTRKVGGKVLSLSGSTITAGTNAVGATAIDTSSSNTFTTCYDTQNDKILLAYRATDGKISIYFITVTGGDTNTLSFSTSANITTEQAQTQNITFDETNNKMIMFWSSDTSSRLGYISQFTSDGSALTEIGTKSQLSGTNTIACSIALSGVWVSGKGTAYSFRSDSATKSVDFTTYFGLTYTQTDAQYIGEAISTTALKLKETPTELIGNSGASITKGDPVVVKTNGDYISAANTVVESSNSGTASSGSTGVIDGYVSDNFSMDVATDGTTYAMCYREQSGQANVIVGTRSGESITWGSPSTLASANAQTHVICYNPDQDVFICLYTNHTTHKIFARAISYSGTTITMGSEIELLNYAWTSGGLGYTSQTLVYDSNSKNVVAFYQGVNDSLGSKMSAVVITASGTTLTAGSENANTSAGGQYIQGCDITGGKLVIYYRDGTNYYPNVMLAEVSGNTVTFGTNVTIASVNYGGICSPVYNPNYTDKAILLGKIVTANNYYSYASLAISGTTITVSNYSDGNINNAASYVESAGKVGTYSDFTGEYCATYQDYSSGGNYYNAYRFMTTTNGETLTVGSQTTRTGDGTTQFYAGVVANDVNKYYVEYNRDDNNTDYVYYVFNPTFSHTQTSTTVNLTAENYIGIAKSSSSAANKTAIITVDGGVDSNQSELTAGQLYYVQTDGTISTTAGSPSVVAGIGLSATELLVTKS
jgi:hypothetical protein